MICELHDYQRNPFILLLVFTVSCFWNKLQLILLGYQLDYGCLVGPNG